MKSSIQKEYPKLVKQPCIQCDGTGETTFSGTYNSQRKCDLCNGKGYIDSKDISQMQSDLELIQSLQKPKQETLEEAAELFFRKKDAKNCTLYKAAKFGAKWQQETYNQFTLAMDDLKSSREGYLKAKEEYELKQQERRYSEEDMKLSFTEGFNARYKMQDGTESREKFLKKFKKK
jgi:RecJ-like exonuclease